MGASLTDRMAFFDYKPDAIHTFETFHEKEHHYSGYLIGCTLEDRTQPSFEESPFEKVPFVSGYSLNDPHLWAEYDLILVTQDFADEHDAKSRLDKYVQDGRLYEPKHKLYMSKESAESLLKVREKFTFCMTDFSKRRFIIDRMEVIHGCDLFERHPELKGELIMPYDDDMYTVAVYYHLQFPGGVNVNFIGLLPDLLNRIHRYWIYIDKDRNGIETEMSRLVADATLPHFVKGDESGLNWLKNQLSIVKDTYLQADSRMKYLMELRYGGLLGRLTQEHISTDWRSYPGEEYPKLYVWNTQELLDPIRLIIQYFSDEKFAAIDNFFAECRNRGKEWRKQKEMAQSKYNALKTP